MVPDLPEEIRGEEGRVSWSCEKIELRGAEAFLVDRGRGKFKPPKPGGRCLAGKHFPGFRRAIPATSENHYNYKRMTISTPVG